MSLGSIIITLDFECGWGSIGNGLWRVRESNRVYENLRPAMRGFLDRLDDLEIRLTWATVGAMIENPATIDLSHLQGAYAAKASEFLSNSQPPTRDGRDLLDMLLKMRTHQAFASHSYSHVLFTDEEQSDSTYQSEILKSISCCDAYNLSCDSLVFPENKVNKLGLVSKTDILKVRMPAKNDNRLSHNTNKITRAYNAVARAPSPVAETSKDSNLQLHYASEFLNWGNNASMLKRAVTKRRIRKAIDSALAGNGIHFWFHPFNLAETQGFADYMDDFLIQIATLRDQDKLKISLF